MKKYHYELFIFVHNNEPRTWGRPIKTFIISPNELREDYMYNENAFDRAKKYMEKITKWRVEAGEKPVEFKLEVRKVSSELKESTWRK